MRGFRFICVIFVLSIGLVAGCQNPGGSGNPGSKEKPPFLSVINGLSESLTFIDKHGDIPVESRIPTGQAPNQILRYNNHVYIINSLSNSITVYDHRNFLLTNEFSTGTGTNPYKAVIVGEKIYVTAYLTHQLLIFGLKGENKKTVPMEVLSEDGKVFFPFPQGIGYWDGYIFSACMYSEENGAEKTRFPGRVAVYSIADGQITGYIEASAKNTNSLYIDNDILYMISSGGYSSGFDESGAIEMVSLLTVDLDSPSSITPVIAAENSSFGSFCVYEHRAWTGNLGNGTLRSYDTTTVPWLEQRSRTFPGGYGMAYIPDIKYSFNTGELYVTEFNGNKIYILDPADLSSICEYSCSSSNYGDAQFMLLIE